MRRERSNGKRDAFFSKALSISRLAAKNDEKPVSLSFFRFRLSIFITNYKPQKALGRARMSYLFLCVGFEGVRVRGVQC